jgi:hypothetical protein
MAKTVRDFLQNATPSWTFWVPPQASPQSAKDVFDVVGPSTSSDLSRSGTLTGDSGANPEAVSKIMIQNSRQLIQV